MADVDIGDVMLAIALGAGRSHLSSDRGNQLEVLGHKLSF